MNERITAIVRKQWIFQVKKNIVCKSKSDIRVIDKKKKK